MRRRLRGLHHQAPGVLHPLAGKIRIEVHDVVRVDQAHEQRPWLAVFGERPPLVAQPGDGAARNQVVEPVAAQPVCQHVARPGEIREAVLLHLAREEPVPVVVVERTVQVPLAFVRGVVTRLAQHVANRRHLGRQGLHPRRVGVFEHAVVGGLQAREQHRAGRSAHHRGAIVVLESHAIACEALVPRQAVAGRQAREEAFLVGENEDDVVLVCRAALAGDRRRRCHR